MNCTIAQNSKSAITTFSFSASWISSPHRPHSLHTDASVNNLGSGMPPSWTFAVDLCQKNVTDFALFYVTHINNQSMTCVDVQASLPHLVPSQHQVHIILNYIPEPFHSSALEPPMPLFDSLWLSRAA